jgi:hypothetical protein
VLKPSYFRALTNEAAIAKMLSLAVHGHMLVGQVAELQHPGIFNLCRQKPPPEAANSQLFPPATSRYSCLQMAAGRRDNSAGSQGYAFVVAKSVCLPVGPDMLDTHIPGTVHSLDWVNVQAYASIFKGLISPEMDALVDGVVDGTWYVWVSVDYRIGRGLRFIQSLTHFRQTQQPWQAPALKNASLLFPHTNARTPISD